MTKAQKRNCIYNKYKQSSYHMIKHAIVTLADKVTKQVYDIEKEASNAKE